ncbi:MAG: mechanosensitive ion channel [Thermofilaceae archaeon]
MGGSEGRRVHSVWFQLKRELLFIVSALLALAALAPLEWRFSPILEGFLPSELVSIFFTLLHVVFGLVFSYFLARFTARAAGALIRLLLPPSTPKLVVGGLNLLVKFAALLVFLTASLYALSFRITAVAETIKWLGEALSGFVSTLIALVIALQLRDIVGNYLAWFVIRIASLVEPGDYVSFSGEILKCVSIGGSHVRFVNPLGEEVYVPNLRFLIETFRKKFSRTTTGYVDMRFTVPYSVPYERVKAAVTRVINELSESNEGVRSYQLLIADLSNYGVVYELWIKPEHPVFPAVFRSSAMVLLQKELGDLLATPMLIQFAEPDSGGRRLDLSGEEAGDQ